MKTILNIILSAVLIITNYNIYSQNEVDALRYSQTFYGGTARGVAMGSAFGALGGDFTSLSINPAGIGVYRTTELTFTPSLYYSQNNASYLGTSFTDNKYNFNFNNIGFVASFSSGNDNGWSNFNMGFGYNRVNNFNRNVLIEGVNDYNSITDYFALRANGQTPEALTSGGSYFMEGLAWDTYLINPIDSTVNQYMSVMNKYGQTQRKSIKTEGAMGEYLFSMGANFSHKLYIGGSIGIQNLRFEENTVYEEIDNSMAIDSFASMTFNQHLKTSGAGFNFKFGTIFRPIDFVRIGFAVHTPTFFVLDDQYQNAMKSKFDNGTIYNYESPQGKYSYELSTPLRAIGSLGFVVMKSAILSVDYEFVDYTSARLRANDYNFYDENSNIQKYYTATSNIRAGAEYRFGPFSFRGGYGIYGNPYSSTNIDNNTIYTSYSGGIGIRDENFFFDLAFVLTKNSENYYLYDKNLVNVSPTTINTNKNQILATFGFKF